MSTRKAKPRVEPFNPGFPPSTPVAVPGCNVCASFARSIRLRRQASDESGAADYRVLMRRHLDQVHREGR